ncbi:hypothetical protein KEM52_003327, partial [Ascosphaera acerosa]
MTIDEAYMLTLARVGQLQTLNYSHITRDDRQNGELYYLSLVRRQLGAWPVSMEGAILAQHPRYAELCALYGEQRRVARAGGAGSAAGGGVDSRSLAARLVDVTFYLPGGASVRRETPRTTDVYAVKALVARALGLPPLGFRLVWVTEEWDPVARA